MLNNGFEDLINFEGSLQHNFHESWLPEAIIQHLSAIMEFWWNNNDECLSGEHVPVVLAVENYRDYAKKKSSRVHHHHKSYILFCTCLYVMSIVLSLGMLSVVL